MSEPMQEAERLALRSALLAAIPDERRVSVGDSVRELHAGGDLTRHAHRRPDVVVFAHSADEVAAVMSLADARGVPVTPFGVGTSPDGHIIPVHGGITLDLSEMNRIVAVRADDQTITVEPGVTRGEANQAAGAHGLMFPVDPGADASLGGMAGTNASGTTTVRYGNMRRQVLELKVVLADGRVVRTGGRALKSSAGYDLTQLFVGSEGTLGVIVELTLRLYAIPERTVAARAAFPDLEAACAAARAIASVGTSLTRVELLDRDSIRAVNSFSGTDLVDAPSLFLEFGGSAAGVDDDARFASEVAAEHGCSDFQVETDHTARVRLWKARHDITFAIAELYPGPGTMISTDVCVPLSEMPRAVTAARETTTELGIEAAIVGHVGDGNFHVVYVFDPQDPAQLEKAISLEGALVEDALACGGTCSGEHGIGLGKIEYLVAEHGDLVPLMQGIKRLLDPNNILNPGKLLPN